MSLLATAVKAKIPLIAVRTDDPRYFPAIVGVLTNKKYQIIRWRTLQGKTPTISSYLNANQLGIMEWQEGIDWHEVGVWLENNSSTLIVTNPNEIHHWMLDLGFVGVPHSMVVAFAQEHSDDPEPIAAALSGLSYTNMTRIASMAVAQYGEFTPTAIRNIRKQFFQTIRGLEEIDTNQLFYEPPAKLQHWLHTDAKLLKVGIDPRITPKGFLFEGPPGTGKTSGAKYIAHTLKLPLYRLDVGAILSKWVGESDDRLRAALKQADSFEPCILLMDEVEKLFDNGEASGAVSRLLGSLLWWLQEHTSKVFVIMTTNNTSGIPKELFRHGRIDDRVHFSGLLQTQLVPFVSHLSKQLSSIALVPSGNLKALVDGITDFPVSQAMVSDQVLKLVKAQIVKQQE